MKSIVSIIFIGAGLAGCSVNDQTESKKPVAPENTVSTEAVSLDSALPEATIMRVELDSKGNPIAGTESMRYINTIGEENLADSFEKGQAAQAGSNELDADSSTQSWYFTRLQDDQDQPSDQPSDGQYPDPNYPNPNDPNQPNPNDPNGPIQNDPNQPGQTYPNQPGQNYPGQTYPGQTYPAPYQPGSVEHRQGPSNAVYPVSRRTVYEHRTTDVYPTQYVDIYPINTVRVHPTRTVTNYHPVQTQIQYVGNYCQPSQWNNCGYGAQFYPTVNYGGYNQFYHYQSYYNYGGYRYYRYCRPGIFGRYSGRYGW